jgi:hypothetical protein
MQKVEIITVILQDRSGRFQALAFELARGKAAGAFNTIIQNHLMNRAQIRVSCGTFHLSTNPFSRVHATWTLDGKLFARYSSISGFAIPEKISFAIATSEGLSLIQSPRRPPASWRLGVIVL